jgi:hypothetical protein
MARAKRTWLGGTMRLAAGTLSAGGALVSIMSYAGAQWELSEVGAVPAASMQPHRLVVTPPRDTASAIGDSLQLAALVTDDRGAALLGVAPSWSSGDPLVAEVDQAGTVVSRGPGSTAIIVRAGGLEARARIAVVPRAAELRLADTLMRVPEGERSRALAQVVDARGHRLADAVARWESADAAIAAVDSVGEVHGLSPGLSTLTATYDQLRAVLPVEVVPVAASITIVGGEDQRMAAGQPLPAPVAAQVVSRTGRPIAGIAASFIVRSGSGAVTPAVDTSDARGMVEAVWTLGEIPGRQQLGLAVEGVAVSPVLTAEADPVRSNTRISWSGDSLVGVSGDPLADPVIVRVTDSVGTALADVRVAWSTPDGGAVSPLGTRTDTLGEVRARWTLGPRTGRQRLRAQVGSVRLLPVATRTAAAHAGAPVSLVLRGGNRQTGTVGKALAQAVVLRALDRHDNPVSGAAITLSTSAGQVSDSALVTDSLGTARVRWTLGRSAGAQRLAARLAGRDAAVEATAQARPSSPASLVFVSPPTRGAAGRALAAPVVVQVADAYGNPVAGRTVAFTPSSGAVAPARAVSDAGGRARVRWTLGKKTGAVRLVGKVVGVAAGDTLHLTARVSARPAP